MVYEKVFKSKNKVLSVFDYFPDQSTYKKREEGETAKPISRETTKEYIAMFVHQNLDLRNVSITVSYNTDEGWVYADNVNLVGDQSLEDKGLKSLLFRDPKTNKHVQSGEYNNDIKHKKLFGVSIEVLYLNNPKPTTANQSPLAKQKKTKYNYVLA